DPISYVGLNSIVIHRNGFTDNEIRQIADIYKIIYLSDLNVTNAVKLVEESLPDSKYRREIVDFVTHSERGIIRSAI
ncbi:MAG: acyl-[acyl-carrier-protein]--UDP-N-acetylglucosamine O-acyltransferase, partial [Muribaculaceae bacterium]|nr:acyl-[acyl-carrier-protein]--UDP-N-acetylglucosamine O-acyltransferase [Muribaculaceae bacterium]